MNTEAPTARVLLTYDEIRVVEAALASHKTINNMEQVIPVVVKMRTARHAMLNDGRAQLRTDTTKAQGE